MRICIVNEFFYPDSTGGTGAVLTDLVRALRDSHDDMQIDVITSNKLYRESAAALPAYEAWNGVNIYRLATPRPNGLAMPLRLAANVLFCLLALGKLLRLGHCDALLIGTAPPMIAMTAQALGRLRQTPFVYIVYDLEPDRSVTMGVVRQAHPAVRLFRAGQRRWLHSAAKVVVLGRCMRERVAQAYDLPEHKTEVIPIGSNPVEIAPGARVSRFRARHGIEGFVALYAGNFGRYHNFDTILDAAKQLHRASSGVQFILVGGGAQKEHIAGRVAAEAIGNVRLFGFVDQEDYADLLASADVSLVTLEPGMEGLCVPSKFYSILASGRPTVAAVSPRSEVARVIDEAECGVHMGQGDAQKLVETLTFLAAHPAEAERMGANARRVLEEKYATPRVAQQYYTVLQEAARSQRCKPRQPSLLTGFKRRLGLVRSRE